MTNISFSNSKSTERLKKILGTKEEQILCELHEEFNPQRLELLEAREVRQKEYDSGKLPEYLRDSEAATTDWSVREIPEDLQTRRVEITGPINDPKMVINMLSRNAQGHRADTAMLDFEDSMKPSWNNVVSGLENIIAVSNKNLSFEKKDKDGNVLKSYALDANDMAFPMVRVRGLHLEESNATVNGASICGGLFDLVCTSLLSAKNFVSNGMTPKFYVPKCEHHLEARWWNNLFARIEEKLELNNGTIRATFLIETLPAAFQIEEILFELKDHIAGLNVGRWDKIFSDIKVMRNHSDRISADRATIDMKKFWMDNYAKRLIKICHSHNAYAIGGMSAFTPGNSEELRNEQTAKVLADKKNEFSIGHDGCWVSHPYFTGPALEAFPKNNQLSEMLPEMDKYPDLIMDGKGPRTMAGLRKNIRVGIAYLHGWNQDLGCVAWDNMMEDLATLEISRAQTWQWLHNKIQLDDGAEVTKDLILNTFQEELDKIVNELNIDKSSSQMSDFTKAMEEAYSLFSKEQLDEFLATKSNIES